MVDGKAVTAGCSSTPRPASPTASAATPRAKSGRLLRRPGQDGVAGVRAGRHPDRPHPAARALRQSLFRRQEAQPLFMTASQSVYALYVEAQGVAGG
jgi:hypothetical protein